MHACHARGSVELFINLANNSRLDALGFRPFGIVVDGGMETVKALYSGYGELNDSSICPDPSAKLCRGPVLERILAEGNDYLARDFPLMAKIYAAWVRA
jgi:hypothetical protein